MFPPWFYALIWQRGYLDSDMWNAGLNYWPQKVFGTVVRPLVGNAPIELRPIAVF